MKCENNGLCVSSNDGRFFKVGLRHYTSGRLHRPHNYQTHGGNLMMLMKIMSKVALTVISMVFILCLVIGLFILSFVVLDKIFGGIRIVYHVLNLVLVGMILLYGIPQVVYIIGTTLVIIADQIEDYTLEKKAAKYSQLEKEELDDAL